MTNGNPCGTLRAKERDEEARTSWRERVLKLEADELVFLDETGGWLGMPRLYDRRESPWDGRTCGGGRVYDQRESPWDDTAPKRRKGKVSLTAAITAGGMHAEACLIHQESVDSGAFLSYLKHVLGPALKPGQTVIMDNFTIHHPTGIPFSHNDKVRELIESRGCDLLYLPVYDRRESCGLA